MIQAETLRRLETSLAGPPKAEIVFEAKLLHHASSEAEAEGAALDFGLKSEIQMRSERAPVLNFKVLVQGTSTADPSKHGFVYGLWREDCVELFIANPENGRYVEFNFAPSGAWWSRVFEDVREPAAMDPPACQSLGRMEANEWSIEAQVDLGVVKDAIGGEPQSWAANLIVLVGGCDDDQPDRRNLHSLANLTSEQPDFHRPQDFLAFESLLS